MSTQAAYGARATSHPRDALGAVLRSFSGGPVRSGVPHDRAAMGSGASNTARYLGGAAGVALVVAIASKGGATDGTALVYGWDAAALVSAGLCATGAVIAACCHVRRPSRSAAPVVAPQVDRAGLSNRPCPKTTRRTALWLRHGSREAGAPCTTTRDQLPLFSGGRATAVSSTEAVRPRPPPLDLVPAAPRSEPRDPLGGEPPTRTGPCRLSRRQAERASLGVLADRPNVTPGG